MQFKMLPTKFLVKGTSQYSSIECMKHSFSLACLFTVELKALGYTNVEVTPC